MMLYDSILRFIIYDIVFCLILYVYFLEKHVVFCTRLREEVIASLQCSAMKKSNVYIEQNRFIFPTKNVTVRPTD